jgi:hypothetical protein
VQNSMKHYESVYTDRYFYDTVIQHK